MNTGEHISVPAKGSSMNRFDFHDRVLFYRLAATSCGDVGVLWTARGIDPSVVSIFLPRPEGPTDAFITDIYPGVEERDHRGLTGLCDRLGRSMAGEDVELPVSLLDLDLCYDFQRRVLLKAKEIPRGMVIPYGRLAQRIGAPRAARAVGTALARNPFSLVLPCHRVVRASGDIGNFGGGPKMKETLLRIEGVEVSNEGRVDRRFFW